MRNVHISLGKHYTISLTQSTMPSGNKTHVEACLFKKGWDIVHPALWALPWVGDEYEDEVIHWLDARDVAQLIEMASTWVYNNE